MVLLWKRTPFDDATGLGPLLVGLIVLLVELPWLTDAPFVPLDVVVVAVTGIVCFLPPGSLPTSRAEPLKGAALAIGEDRSPPPRSLTMDDRIRTRRSMEIQGN